MGKHYVLEHELGIHANELAWQRLRDELLFNRDSLSHDLGDLLVR